MVVKLKAGPGRCEEASLLSRETYIPCNAPATSLIHSSVDRRHYRMCAACADHAIRHRGMTFVGKYLAPQPGLDRP